MDDPAKVHVGRGNRQKPRFEELMEPSELAELVGKVKEADPVAFADALQKDAQGHFQVMFKRGFGTAKTDADEKITALNDRLEAAGKGHTDLEAELGELRKKQPDLEKWKEEKEAALLAKETEWKGKYEALQTELVAGKTKAEKARVIASLKDDAHVEAFIAESALANEEIASRMKVQGDGSIRFYQKDGQTPLVPAEGENPAKLFALSLVAEKVIPEQYVKPPRNTGGPGSDYKGGGGAPTATKRSDMSVKEKSEFVKEHGSEAFLELPA